MPCECGLPSLFLSSHDLHQRLQASTTSKCTASGIVYCKDWHATADVRPRGTDKRERADAGTRVANAVAREIVTGDLYHCMLATAVHTYNGSGSVFACNVMPSRSVVGPTGGLPSPFHSAALRSRPTWCTLNNKAFKGMPGGGILTG
jgi:hypothetical protein